MNYYKVLELEVNCTPAEIKAAYRRIAKEIHPDNFINKPEAAANASHNFTVLKEAYRVLKDPDLRRAHDIELFGSSYAGVHSYNGNAAYDTYSSAQDFKHENVITGKSAAKSVVVDFPDAGFETADLSASWKYVSYFALLCFSFTGFLGICSYLVLMFFIL